MSAKNFFRKLMTRSLRAGKGQPIRTHAPRARLRLEAVEDRTVPTQVTIAGGGASSWIIDDTRITDNGLPAGGISTGGANGAGASFLDASIPGQGDAFDDASMVFVNGNQVNGALTQSGNTVTFASEVIGGLTAQLQYYIASGSATARSLLSLTNPTGSPITVTVDWANNVGSDGGTVVQGTSSGDTTLTTGDRWIVTDDGVSGDPAVSHALFGPGSPAVTPGAVSQTVFSSAGTQGVLATYSVTVPAGSTRSLLWFHQLNDTSANGLANAAATFDTNPPTGGDLLSGLSVAQLSEVVNWQFVPPNVTIDGSGNLVFTDNAGANDTLTLQFNAATSRYVITDTAQTLFTSIPGATGSGTNTVSIPAAAVTGPNIVFNGMAGTDTLNVDYSLGAIAKAVNYTGGGGFDSLALAGPAVASQTFNYTNETDGSVQVSGQGLITYTGLSPISSTITAATVTLNYSTTAETITVTANGAQTQVDSNVGGEVTSFNNPTGLLEINAGGTGGDVINVNGFGPGFAAALDIDGEGGTDTISINTALTLGNGANTGNLTLSAETINLNNTTVRTDGGTNSGNVSLTGSVILGSAAASVVTIDTDGGGTDGAVVVNGTINTVGANSDQGLAIVAGGGAVSLGTIGNTGVGLGSLSVSTTGLTTLNGNITTDPAPLSGNIDFSAATGGITLNNSITLNSDGNGGSVGGAVNFANTAINSATPSGQGLTITAGDGAVTLNLVGNLGIGIGALSVTTTGLTTLNGNITTDPVPLSGNINFSGATGGITLGNSITINSDGNGGSVGGAINLTGSAVNAATASGQGLTIIAGNGAVSLGTIGNLGIGIGALSVTTTGPTTLNGNITTDPVPLSGDINFSGATGGITLNANVTINSDGNGGSIGGAVNFANTAVNALAFANQQLAITAGNGTVTLNTVGTTTPLGRLAVTTTGVTTLNGNIAADEGAGPGDIDFSTATGGVVLGNDITINSDATLGGASGFVLLSGSTVTPTAAGQQGLTIIAGDGNGLTAVHILLAGTAALPLEFLTIQRTSVISDTRVTGNIFTDNTTGTGTVQTTGVTANVRLDGNVTINTDAGGSGIGGAVNFATSTINAFTAGAQGLNIVAPGGAVTLGPVGATTALSTLTVNPTGNPAGPVTLNSTVTATGAITIRTNSALAVNNAITSNTAGAVTLEVTDAAAAGQNLSIGATTVTAAGGNVVLRGGDDVSIPVGATVAASGTITVVGDFGNADVGTGSTITLRGNFNATSLSATGDNDSDTFNVLPDDTTPISVNGLNPTAPTLPGDVLNYDAAGLATTTTPTTITSTGRAAVSYTNIETVNLLNVGNVVVDGDAANNTLTLISTGANAYTYQLDSGPVFVVNPANGSFTFNGNGGSDQIIVRYTGGVMPAVPITFNGGESAGDNDRARLERYNVTTATVNHLGAENGTVQLTGNALFTFGQTEPLALAGDAANVIINLPAGPNTDALLADDGVVNFPADPDGNTLNTTAIDGSTFEFTQFTNPTASLAVNFGANGDTLRVRTLDALFPAATSVTFTGAAGNDTVIFDYSNGAAFKPLGGSTFNVNLGGQGPDLIALATNNAIPGGPFPNLRQTHFNTGNDVGTFHVDPDDSAGAGAPTALLGTDALTVNYTGVPGIESTIPAGTIDYILGTAGNAVSVDNAVTAVASTLVPAGTAAQQLTDGNSSMTTFRYVNATNVRLMGNSGGDVVSLSATTNPAGLTTFEAYGHIAPGVNPTVPLPADDNATDRFNLNSTQAATTNLFGQGGSDVFEDGLFNLSNLTGVINITGGETPADADVLNLQDPLAAGPDLVTLTNTQLTGAAPATINYTEVESFFLETTAGNDTINVLSTALGTRYVVAGDGGNDTITIGNQTADFNTVFDGSLDAILGDIAVSGEFNFAAGTDTLNVDDSGTASLAGTASLSTAAAYLFDLGPIGSITDPVTVLNNFAPAVIRYYHTTFNNGGFPTSLENLNVLTSTGNDTVNVNVTTATVATTLSGREGNDTITVAGDALAGGSTNTFVGFDGNDVITVNAGAGITATATLIVQGDNPNAVPVNPAFPTAPPATGAADILIVNGTPNADAITQFLDTPGGNGRIAGLGGTGGQFNYTTFEQVTVNGGLGANTYTLSDNTGLSFRNPVNPLSAPQEGVVIAPTPGGDSARIVVNQGPVNVSPVIYVDQISLNGFTYDGGAAPDLVTVLGVSSTGLSSGAPYFEPTLTNGRDVITVTESQVAIDVNNGAVPWLRVNLTPTTVSHLVVRGGNEAGPAGDTFTVTPSLAVNIFVDGMNPPAGSVPGDVVNFNASGIARAFTDPALGPPNVRFEQFGGANPGAGFTYVNFETVNVTSTSGRLDILGDRGQTSIANPAGTDAADVVSVTGTGARAGSVVLNGGGFTFSGINDLRVLTFDLDDAVGMTPFATAVQPWDIAVTVDGGATGIDRLVYTNAATVFDDTRVVGTGVGAGRIDAPGIGSATTNQVVRFLGIEQVTTNANAGDGDALTLELTNAADTVTLVFDPSAPATENQPAAPNDVLTQLFNLVIDTVNNTGLTITTRGGNDTVTLDLVGAGTLPIPIDLDAGTGTDTVALVGNAGADTFGNTPGATATSGEATIAGADTGAISYSNVENLSYNGGGGGADAVVVTGTPGDDVVTVTETAGAAAGTVSATGQPAIAFTAMGSGSTMSVITLGGDDQITFLQAVNWGIGTVNVDAGPPTASDTMAVIGTPVADQFIFDPATRVLTVIPSGSTPVVYNGVNLEIFNFDGAAPGAAPGDTLTITSFLPGAATTPSGTLGGPGLQLNYQNFETVTVGTAPTATDDPAVVDEDSFVHIDVLGNDFVQTGTGTATLSLVTLPANGTATVLAVTDPTNPYGQFGALNGGNPRQAIRYTPNADFPGAVAFDVDTFDYRVTDTNGQSDTATVTVTVNAVNDAPVNTVPGPQNATEDLVHAITGLSVADIDVGAGNLTVTLQVTNGTLTATGAGVTGSGTNTVIIDGIPADVNAALATLTYQGNPDFNGTDTLSVTTSDNGNTGTPGAQVDIDNITINVAAVNDAPINTLPAQTGTEDTTTAVTGLAVADVDALAGNVTVRLSVTNGTLAGTGFTPASGATIEFTGTLAAVNAALASVTFTPALDFNGNATLTMTTSDNGNTGSGGALVDIDTVDIAVAAVNDAPVAVADAYTTDEDTLLTVPAPGVLGNDTDVDGPGATAVLVTDVANGTLTLNADGSFTYDPNPDFNGTDSFTYQVDDTAAANNLSNIVTVTITVNAVNDAPVNTVPAAQTVDEDTDLPFSAANGNAISTADVDAGTADVRVTLSVTNGVLTVQPTAGVVVGNSGTANVTLEGPVAQVNAALDTLVYRANLNYNGPDQLIVVTNDLGNTGSGGNQVVTNTIDITVNAVNDAPVNTVPGPQTATEDVARTITGLSVADVDVAETAGGTLTVTLSVLNGTLTATAFGAAVVGGAGTDTLTITGIAADVNDTLATLSYTGDLHFSGADTLTMLTTDNGNTGTPGPLTDTDTVAITVTAVADAPNLTANTPANGTETVAIPLTITSSLVDADGSETLSIDIFGVPVNATFNQGTNLGGGQWRFTPAQLAGLTITVSDNAAFNLNVVATATEGSNGDAATTTQTIAVNVTNTNPTATMTNDGAVNEGSTGTVTVGNQNDVSPADVQAGFRYSFDFDNDGNFEVGNGTYAGSVTNPAATVPAEFLDDGPGTREVRARVFDKDGGFVDVFTTITINNVAPTATFTASGPLIERQPVTLTFANQFDPSQADTAAGFTYSYDLDNDGVFEIANSKSPTATFTPPTQGTFTIRGRIFDKDGDFTEYTAGGAAGVVIANVDRYMVGTGPGGAPHVRVYTTDGQELKSFYAYDPDFRGGVTVATADVTGDGIPDVITGTGPTGGPVVKVFDGVTFQMIASFLAYEESFRGGLFVAGGDVDGDGRAEIITGVGVGGGPVVKVFRGLAGQLVGSFAAYEESFRGGVNVAAADLNGDGRAEIITGAGVGGGSVVKVFNGQTLAQINSFNAYEDAYRGGVNVAGGDLDGDGRGEIVTGTGIGGGARLRTFDALTAAPELSVFAFGPDRITGQPLRNGFRVAVTDIDGDGDGDVLAGSGPDFSPIISVREGNTLNEIRFFLPYDPHFLGGVYLG